MPGEIDVSRVKAERGRATPSRTLGDQRFVKRSMLTNPFEKFERKRFMYYSKDLGVISLNHALMARLNAADYDAVRTQMREDLDAYYAKLNS